MCNGEAGLAVPMPTLLLELSTFNVEVSKVASPVTASVPDADIFVPLIAPALVSDATLLLNVILPEPVLVAIVSTLIVHIFLYPTKNPENAVYRPEASAYCPWDYALIVT